MTTNLNTVPYVAPPPIDGDLLAGMLLDTAASVLAFDARPYSSFVMSHISNAINVRLSNILARRLAVGKIQVEDLLSEAHRTVFLACAAHALIVIYDDRAGATEECEAKVTVIKALQASGCRTALLSCTLYVVLGLL